MKAIQTMMIFVAVFGLSSCIVDEVGPQGPGATGATRARGHKGQKGHKVLPVTPVMCLSMSR
jgi:hypothetical protein